MLQDAGHAVPAVAFDDGQRMADHRIGIGAETAPVSADDRVFRIDVQVDQRCEIEVDAAGGHGGGARGGVARVSSVSSAWPRCRADTVAGKPWLPLSRATCPPSWSTATTGGRRPRLQGRGQRLDLQRRADIAFGCCPGPGRGRTGPRRRRGRRECRGRSADARAASRPRKPTISSWPIFSLRVTAVSGRVWQRVCVRV